MRDKISTSGVELEKAPVETPGSIGLAERNTAPLRFTYNKIRTTLAKNETIDAECLHMSVYSMRATIGMKVFVSCC